MWCQQVSRDSKDGHWRNSRSDIFIKQFARLRIFNQEHCKLNLAFILKVWSYRNISLYICCFYVSLLVADKAINQIKLKYNNVVPKPQITQNYTHASYCMQSKCTHTYFSFQLETLHSTDIPDTLLLSNVGKLPQGNVFSFCLSSHLCLFLSLRT